MDEEREEEEILDFVRSIRDEARDVARLVGHGVISRKKCMNIKAKRDDGDTTIAEDEKVRTYDTTMSGLRDIDSYAGVVLTTLKRKYQNK